jgi:hypothetical protein
MRARVKIPTLERRGDRGGALSSYVASGYVDLGYMTGLNLFAVGIV